MQPLTRAVVPLPAFGPPKGWKKRNEKQKLEFDQKDKRREALQKLGGNNAGRLLRAQGLEKKIRKASSNCHQLPLAVRTVIQEKG